MKSIAVFLVLSVLTSFPTSNSQGIIIPGLGNIWELGTQPFDQACLLTGNPSLEPVFGTDPWFANAHCITHQGSAGCVIEDPALGYGMCRCNQGNSGYFTTLDESEGTQICLGKVGAFCSTEKSWFFPDKLCTPNAYCQPNQLGQGRQVGTCRCLYGFNTTDEGLCEENENIGEPERSTPPTTTTSEAPPKAAFKLPPLDLLIGVHEVSLNEDCYPNPLLPLNRTICNTFGRTVACLRNDEDRLQCQCNQQADSVFDEERNMCVGKVGSYCLARKWLLGNKFCTKNAECEMEDEGMTFEQGYSFGTCECLYGYKPTENGLCERDNSIPDPSTPRPGPTTPTSPTTEEPDDDETTSAGDGVILNGMNKFVILMSVVYFIINI